MSKEAVMHRETGEVSVMHGCFIYSAGDKDFRKRKRKRCRMGQTVEKKKVYQTLQCQRRKFVSECFTCRRRPAIIERRIQI